MSCIAGSNIIAALLVPSIRTSEQINCTLPIDLAVQVEHFLGKKERFLANSQSCHKVSTNRNLFEVPYTNRIGSGLIVVYLNYYELILIG